MKSFRMTHNFFKTPPIYFTDNNPPLWLYHKHLIGGGRIMF